MIKRMIMIVLFAVSVFFLSSCNSSDNVYNVSQQVIMPDDTIDFNGMNLYKQHDNLYFALDDNAKLSLFVNAEIMDNGDFAFDSGHDWLFIMETSFGNYPLLPRQHLQHGTVSYTVFSEGVILDIFHVLLTVHQSAGLEIYDFVFDNEAKVFHKIPVYSVNGINPMVRQ